MFFVAPPSLQLHTPEQLLTGLNAAMASSQRPRVEAFFQNPKRDSPYLFSMISNRGGFGKVRVCLLPTPPGWKGYGKYWAVFHTFQMIEEDHDPVYHVDDTSDGLRLGREIAEDDLAGWRIEDQDYTAHLSPESGSVTVHVVAKLKAGMARRAIPYRLNDIYQVKEAVAETATNFVVPKPGDLVRAGSLLIPWSSEPAKRFTFDYSGVLPPGSDDEIVSNAAYVTAWWLPSLGRLPFTVHSRIVAPADWTVRAEGRLEGQMTSGRETVSEFTCNLPISYPKIVGGKYSKVSEATASNRDRFAIFQVPPINKERADRDLRNMMQAADFYERILGPLPFHGYECYDADKFYGIESYSHTVLQREVTHFISHEMGHSYFGGLAPCPYVHDSWNEGVTEYIDSVLLLKDADRSLERGLETLNVAIPLTQMPVPWSNRAASYWRGCYVMKMLEAEIGPDQVVAALRSIAMSRRGMDTRWDDLRPYFEHAGHTRLDWFWMQWIDGATFPTISIVSQRTESTPTGFRTYVKVVQSGTEKPYRLRFTVKSGGERKAILLEAASVAVVFDSRQKPVKVELDAFPLTLAAVTKAQKVTTQTSLPGVPSL